MAHRLSGKVLAFIRSQRVARLATVGRDGTPHNIPVCTVAASGRLYFASEKDARKVRNIARNPRANAAHPPKRGAGRTVHMHDEVPLL